MTATAHDYLWVDAVAPAYCIALVRGLTPDDVLDRFGVTGDRTCVSGLAPVGQVGVTAAGDWALAVEVNGYLGVTAEVMDRLSAGTRLVAHFRNVNALHRFCLVDDGDVRLDFDPVFAWDRGGCDPDGQVDLMRAVGMATEKGSESGHPGAACFALAQALTGVRLTPEILAKGPARAGRPSWEHQATS